MSGRPHPAKIIIKEGKEKSAKRLQLARKSAKKIISEIEIKHIISGLVICSDSTTTTKDAKAEILVNVDAGFNWNEHSKKKVKTDDVNNFNNNFRQF